MRHPLLWPLLAWLVWALPTLGMAIHAYFHPFSHTVYPVYALASRKWWLGEDIYQVVIEHYRYSPLFAILVTPFAMLPDGLGNALWKVGNIGFFALGLQAMAHRLLPWRLSRNQTAALFLLTYPLTMHSAYNAQANLVMLGAVLLGLAAAVAQRWNRAALWLALATLIKGYPLAAALLVMALYPKSFSWRFVLALASGLVLPFAIQWPSTVAAQYQSWIHHLGDSTSIMRERLRSLDHLLLIYGVPVSPRLFALLGLLGGGLVLALCLWQARKTTDPRERLTCVFLLFATWGALLGPATETCTYVIMGPPIAWALVEVFARSASWATRLVLLASLLMMGPLVTDLAKPFRHFANSHGSQPLGALLFLGYQVMRISRSGKNLTQSRSTKSVFTFGAAPTLLRAPKAGG